MENNTDSRLNSYLRMKRNRIEVICGGEDMGLACIITPGEEPDKYYLDKMQMEPGDMGDVQRWTLNTEEALAGAFKGTFIEYTCMDFKEIRVKVIVENEQMMFCLWETARMNREDIIELGFKAVEAGIKILKNSWNPERVTTVETILLGN